MDLGDILKGVAEDPEDQRRNKQLVDDLCTLKDRLAKDLANVSDGEIVGGIRKQFDLMLSSDFLDEASWLMDSLSFTRSDIRHDEISIAWEMFQKNQGSISELRLDEYPILEGIAHWYFDHRHDQDREENTMVVRSLAVYEYLVQQLRGHEAVPEFEDILAGDGISILYLYCGLELYERAKFYGQLLDMEYRAGRLASEEYELVQQAFATIRHKEITERADRDQIYRLQWDTIVDRDQKLQEFERKLGEITARVSSQADIDGARERISKKLGSTWQRLHAETKKHLAVADAFSQEPLSRQHPDIPPCYFFKALNAELHACLFKPGGTLEAGVLSRLKVYSPVALLIEFDRNTTLEKADTSDIQEALDTVGGKGRVCSRINIEQLKHLRDHRNRIEHPEQRRKVYSEEQLHELLRTIWTNDWLVSFLRRLHQL